MILCITPFFKHPRGFFLFILKISLSSSMQIQRTPQIGIGSGIAIGEYDRGSGGGVVFYLRRGEEEGRRISCLEGMVWCGFKKEGFKKPRGR